jgi:hypothetical protein
MTLNEFINRYDTDDAIVLLEGKRHVLEADEAKLRALGTLLASRTSKILFRSGNAEGADQFFSEGVAAVDRQRLQVITPYAQHRKKSNQAYETISLEQIDIANEPEVFFHSKGNKKTEKLVDRFVAGEKNQYTIKAAYIIRDTVKALGTREIKPATFGIFYDDLNDPKTGGTGHTMNVCEKNGIPVVDQRVWFGWLE